MTGQTLWANPTPLKISITQDSALLTISPFALTFATTSLLTISGAYGTMGNLVMRSMFIP